MNSLFWLGKYLYILEIMGNLVENRNCTFIQWCSCSQFFSLSSQLWLTTKGPRPARPRYFLPLQKHNKKNWWMTWEKVPELSFGKEQKMTAILPSVWLPITYMGVGWSNIWRDQYIFTASLKCDFLIISIDLKLCQYQIIHVS